MAQIAFIEDEEVNQTASVVQVLYQPHCTAINSCLAATCSGYLSVPVKSIAVVCEILFQSLPLIHLKFILFVSIPPKFKI